MRHLKIVVEEHADGFVAYPVGLRGTPPNDSPYFIEALADVVVDYLARRPVDHQLHRPDGPHAHR